MIIVVRGNRISPIVPSGRTIIINDTTIIFNKIESRTTYNPIVYTANRRANPLPSGNKMTIDGTQVDFIKTRSAYDDIEIIGTAIIISPLTSAETLSIYHSSSSTDPLEQIDIPLLSGDTLNQVVMRITAKLQEFRLQDIISAENDNNRFKNNKNQ